LILPKITNACKLNTRAARTDLGSQPADLNIPQMHNESAPGHNHIGKLSCAALSITKKQPLKSN